MNEPEMKVVYFALTPMQIADEMRNAGDMVPEACGWKYATSYLSNGQLGVIPVSVLSADDRRKLYEWEQEQAKVQKAALKAAEKAAEPEPAAEPTDTYDNPVEWSLNDLREALSKRRDIDQRKDEADRANFDFPENIGRNEAVSLLRRLDEYESSRKSEDDSDQEPEEKAFADRTKKELKAYLDAHNVGYNTSDNHETLVGYAEYVHAVETKDYESLTVDLLKGLLTERSIEFKSDDNKPELIEALQKNDAAPVG